MCTGLEILAGAALIGGGASAYQARQSAKAQRGAIRNAEAERRETEAKANQAANMKAAFAKRALRDNSLFTGGGTAGSAEAPGQQTLGV
jgi:hypothetical protein